MNTGASVWVSELKRSLNLYIEVPEHIEWMSPSVSQWTSDIVPVTVSPSSTSSTLTKAIPRCFFQYSVNSPVMVDAFPPQYKHIFFRDRVSVAFTPQTPRPLRFKAASSRNEVRHGVACQTPFADILSLAITHLGMSWETLLDPVARRSQQVSFRLQQSHGSPQRFQFGTASQRIVLSSSSASKFLEFLLS